MRTQNPSTRTRHNTEHTINPTRNAGTLTYNPTTSTHVRNPTSLNTSSSTCSDDMRCCIHRLKTPHTPSAGPSARISIAKKMYGLSTYTSFLKEKLKNTFLHDSTILCTYTKIPTYRDFCSVVEMVAMKPRPICDARRLYVIYLRLEILHIFSKTRETNMCQFRRCPYHARTPHGT